MQRVARVCQRQLILVILRRQGRRSHCDGEHVPQHYLSSQVKSSDCICTLYHKVLMVKIRRIFHLKLGVYFMAFYFTKTQILLFLLTPYQGSAPGPRWGLPSRRPAMSPGPNHEGRSMPMLGLPALNAEHYTTATYSPRVWVSIVH